MIFSAVVSTPHRQVQAVRKIIHIDMDAFYASIEQRDHPELRGKPVAVGGSSRRGVVMTASYEARRFGVKSAMPGFKALRLCPELILVKPRFDAYKAASRRFHDIMREITPEIEPLSLDEAFMDVTRQAAQSGSATAIAALVRTKIREELHITASAGISYNKFLAKLASGMRKPDGSKVIRPERARTLLAGLPIERFHGVGPATAKRLNGAGIHFGRDLQAVSETEASRLLGSSGVWFWHLAQGIDERPVSTASLRKSLSVETTFTYDLSEPEVITQEIEKLAEKLSERCIRAGFWGRTLTLKLKYNDFQLQTRSQTPSRMDLDPRSLSDLGVILLSSRTLEKPVRLIGLGLHGSREISEQEGQLGFDFMDNHSA